VIGTVLIIPWPYVTFGLFSTAYDIGQAKAIKLNAFFVNAQRIWKLAYIWGGINLGMLIILGININFYTDIAAQWAVFARTLIAGLAVFWGVLQLVVLPLYPRLEEPSFQLALRNAAILVGRHPVVIITLAIIAFVILVISFIFPILFFLLAPATIAIVSNRLVGAMVDTEMERKM
jgi:uncharacterized membrane protein YesL